ncbi:MAG: type II secretion system protein [bacterium]
MTNYKLQIKNKQGAIGGFTLIELLIVIAVIGILAAVLISVLNPAQQRTKANEAVLRSTVGKICLAWGSCLSSSTTGVATDCNTPAKMGLEGDAYPASPTGAVYSYVGGRPQGVLGTCTIFCSTTTNLPTLSGACVITQ